MATGTALSDYLENALLNEVLRNTNFVPPTTVYVALFTAAPGETGGGTEVSGLAYARQAVTFGAASGGQCSNSAEVAFPAASTPGWGTITHVGIFDAATTGNLLFYGALSENKPIGTSDIFRFPVGNLICALD